MIYNTSKASVDAKPPISTVSVNKFNVVFKDSETLKRVRFDNSLETRKFLNWLVTI